MSSFELKEGKGNIMPNKDAKNRKRKRILKNEQLSRDGRTPAQIARKRRKRNNV